MNTPRCLRCGAGPEAKRSALMKRLRALDDRTRAKAILRDANNKDIIAGRSGRGLRKWAERLLVDSLNPKA